MGSKRYIVKWTEVDGRRVRYRIVLADERPRTSMPSPLLLIHGLGCSADTWSKTMKEFARLRADQPVIAMDMPGYGHSQDPTEPMNIDQLGDWIARFMDAIDIDVADIAANSMGCQVALATADRHADRVRRVAVLGPTLGDGATTFQYSMRLLGDSVREPLWYNLRLMRMYAEMGPVDYVRVVKRMMDDGTLARAPRIEAPTLVIRGKRDLIVTRKSAQKLAAALPHATYAEIDRAAHAAEFSKPRAFTNAVLSFLLAPTITPSRTLAGRAVA